ncbi:glycosyltransferase family 2 protein [bacterium]|nr:glycosyltransferase family 2 protein [bacterium]
MDISVVIPVYNERASLPALHPRLASAMEKLGRAWEVIYVDDGSGDGSGEWLAETAKGDRRVRVVSLCRNFGQTAALMAGFDHAQGELVATLDADGQNAPEDIPQLVEQLEREGLDVVSGWRRPRADPFLTRRLPSMLANRLIGLATGLRLHDYGCTLKLYKKRVLSGVRLYGEMHRFLPAYVAAQGGCVGECVVSHAPRRAGRSKYGLGRTFKVLLDLLTFKFLTLYSNKPIYVFGLAGLACFGVSLLSGLYAVYLKYGAEPSTNFNRTPLPLLCVAAGMIGVQFILLGLLAEMLVRTYHESQGRPIYQLRDGP